MFNGPILGVFACALLTTSVTGMAVRAGLVAGFSQRLRLDLSAGGVVAVVERAGRDRLFYDRNHWVGSCI